MSWFSSWFFPSTKPIYISVWSPIRIHISTEFHNWSSESDDQTAPYKIVENSFPYQYSRIYLPQTSHHRSRFIVSIYFHTLEITMIACNIVTLTISTFPPSSSHLERLLHQSQHGNTVSPRMLKVESRLPVAWIRRIHEPLSHEGRSQGGGGNSMDDN